MKDSGASSGAERPTAGEASFLGHVGWSLCMLLCTILVAAVAIPLLELLGF
jgi:hypothetical protein